MTPRFAPLIPLAFAAAAAAQNGTFFQIPGWTQAEAVSADGLTVGGAIGNTAAIWNIPAATSTTIGPGLVTGLSSDGSAAAGQIDPTSSFPHVFRWTQSSGETDIGVAVLYPRISGDGSTVVASDNIAYRWTPASGRQNLELPNGYPLTYALDISTDGSTIVGNAEDSSTSVPVVWHGTAATIVGPNASQPQSELSTVNADGTVAFGWHIGETADAFRWTPAGGNQELGMTGGIPIPRATTAAGDIFIGYTWAGQSWVWRSGAGPRLLSDVLHHDFGINLSGMWLFDPAGISADGTVIVGTGEYTATGERFGWVITLPRSIPSPASAIPLAALILAPRRRRYTP